MAKETDLSHKALLIYLAKRKSPAACAALEVATTLFGFSGVGIMYAGRPLLGFIVLMLFWTLFFSSVCTGAILFTVWGMPLWLLLVAVSASQAARQHNQRLIGELAASDNEADGDVPAVSG